MFWEFQHPGIEATSVSGEEWWRIYTVDAMSFDEANEGEGSFDEWYIDWEPPPDTAAPSLEATTVAVTGSPSQQSYYAPQQTRWPPAPPLPGMEPWPQFSDTIVGNVNQRLAAAAAATADTLERDSGIPPPPRFQAREPDEEPGSSYGPDDRAEVYPPGSVPFPDTGAACPDLRMLSWAAQSYEYAMWYCAMCKKWASDAHMASNEHAKNIKNERHLLMCDPLPDRCFSSGET